MPEGYRTGPYRSGPGTGRGRGLWCVNNSAGNLLLPGRRINACRVPEGTGCHRNHGTRRCSGNGMRLKGAVL